MAVKGSNENEGEKDDMLPDERQVIVERAQDLVNLDDEEYLTVDELAAKLNFERD